MSGQELGLAAIRAVQLLGLIWLTGALLFLMVIAPPVLAGPLGGTEGEAWRRLHRLARLGWCAALAGSVAWLAAESVAIAGAGSLEGALAAMPDVALHTQFGHVMLTRVGLLLGAGWLLCRPPEGWRGWLAVGMAAFALALQAMLGHAAAAGGREGHLLVAAMVLHMLAAGAWLGGLAPLLVLVRKLPSRAAADAARRFSPLGLACVVTLAGSAVIQGSLLLGGVGGLFGTAYGWVALTKSGLFAALIAIAAYNKFVLTPSLTGGRGRAALAAAIGAEIALGLLVIGAAALLGSLPPGAHEQPVWPFERRPSLAALSEPELRREVLVAAAELAVAVLLAGLAIVWRRGWPAAGALAVVLVFLAAPHLDLLLVDAYPTSYAESPTGFTGTAIVGGSRLYDANCVACHGAEGRGDGPLAASLPVRPADLTAAHLWDHSDGELFWWLSHGMDGPRGEQTMPGFANRLTEGERWDLIDFIRARNAGLSNAATGAWEHPIQVPDIDLACSGPGATALGDLRPQAAIIAAAPEQPVASVPGAVTIALTRRGDEQPDIAACRGSGEEAWGAFSIIAGVKPDSLAGSVFLVDGAGWLRRYWPENAPPSGADLAQAVAAAAAAPVAMPAGGHHHH